MPSTLSSIYNAQRGLALGQAAIDIINNNISNMNTKGYSKQRLEISQYSNMSPYQNPIDASQDGMGAIIDAVTRNRDAFIDTSFRKETTDLNYYKEYSNNAVQLETIINEMGDTGLSSALNEFYNGLSQLSANPNDFVTRNSVVQDAITLTNKFNDVYTSLQDTRTSLVGDINSPDTLTQSKLSLSIDDLNSKLTSIADLNDKINVATAQGITPNSLLDQRDSLLDSISEYLPTTMKTEENNTVSVFLGSIQLVNGSKVVGNFDIQAGDINNPSIVRVTDEEGTVYCNDASSLITSGSIGAMIQLGGSDSNNLTIKGLIDSINTLANQFASAINYYQTNGRYIVSADSPHELSDNESDPLDPLAAPGTGADDDPVNFFTVSGTNPLAAITAGNIKVNDAIVTDPYQISAAKLTSTVDETGDGSNALLMSKVRDLNTLTDNAVPIPNVIMDLGGPTTQGFITKLVGKLGTQSKNIQDNYDIKSNIVQQVTQKRDSLTGVNLDEELADLIRFQKAYEASAKVMTTINQTLSTIINMI